MRTDEFDYELPSGLIAQEPVEPRDSCRLLVLGRVSGEIAHRAFSDIGEYLRPRDLLVVNETRVMPARLIGVKRDGGGVAELLLLKERGNDTWECLVRPGRRMQPGTAVTFGDGELTALVVGRLEGSGVRLVQFHVRSGRFMDAVHRFGEVPLPPYISKPLADPEEYQTVFGTEEHSAAAPTAGLHFTQRLLDELVESGVHLARIELDVGVDTFRPISEEDPALHPIHSEHCRVPPWTADAVNACREQGGRVVAVGTTVVRALESALDLESGEVRPMERDSSLYIMPGYRFGAVDAMVTNFHVPRSTLLLLVSAFAGRDSIKRAYRTAIARRYRFLSFGDAMLIV